jgi:hypothetical protein
LAEGKCTEVLALLKQVQAVRSLTRACKSGVGSKTFLDEFDAQAAHLAESPVAVNPAPLFMRLARYDKKVDLANLGQDPSDL